MAQIISILNFKGGCAKTTTTVNLAAAMNLLGKKVLVVDIDFQANTSDNLGFKPNMGNTMFELLTQKLDEMPIYEYHKGFDYIPSSGEMQFINNILVNKNRREYILKKFLQVASPHYDYILIDCPAGGGLLNTNAMAAADKLLIPIICEPYDIKGLTKMLADVQTIRDDEVNPDLEIGGLLITRYDTRLSQHKIFASDMRFRFPNLVYNARIRGNADLPKAAGEFKTIFEYKPHSSGAEDYLQLAREITGSKKKVTL